MSLSGFVQWLADTPWSVQLHESLFGYPLLESVHVLTLCVFVGMSVLLDLRLLNITLRRVPVSELFERLAPWLFGGFAIMMVTGVLLFFAIPIRSYHSIWFRGKLILLVLAGLNAWTFHGTIWKHVREWDTAPISPARARFAGAASLILWAGIIVFGRMIAYNWFDCDLQQSAFIVWAAGCPAGQQ
jgi:hypothetical protein